jgi:hypothetical protein
MMPNEKEISHASGSAFCFHFVLHKSSFILATQRLAVGSIACLGRDAQPYSNVRFSTPGESPRDPVADARIRNSE